MSWTEQQHEAIAALAPRICVDAGAGSGKTRVLVDRIVHLLDTRLADLDEIVAITFTDKAAAEMKARLRKAFRAKAPADDPEAMNRWRDLERRTETARVCTIHAFCTALLKENAFRLGLDPDFAVLPEAETALLLDEVVTETLHDLFEGNDPAAMNLAVELPFNRLRQTLIGMLRKSSLMDRIMAQWRFDDAGALQQRWEAARQAEHARRLEALRHDGHVHSYLKKLRGLEGACSNPDDARERRRQTMMDALENIRRGGPAREIERQLQRILEKSKDRASKKNWQSEEAFKAITDLQKEIEKFAGIFAPDECDPDQECAAAQLTCDLAQVYRRAREAFDAAKANANCKDFDDLITGTRLALRNDAELRQRVAADIRFLLIDEFQDTDETQLEIAQMLSEAPGGPGLFIVGDAKQSIYLFRGAEVEVFQRQRLRSGVVLPLSRNFRSLPDVLGFVNDFFAASGLLSAVEDYQPMEADRTVLGAPRIEFLVAGPRDGDDQKWSAEELRQAEARHIAARIQDWCGASGLDVFDERQQAYRPAAYGDVALLFRGMNQVYLYEDALRRAGIPYALVAGAGFYERQEIRDVLNVLKVVLDPWDEAALLGFLRGPLGRLSDESLLRMCLEGNLAVVFQGADTPQDLDQPGELDAARALIAGLRARREQPLPALLREVLEVTGLESVLLTQFLGLQKASNVRKLIGLAEEFAGRGAGSLRAFVNYLDEISGQVREGEALLQPESGGAVTLMTIHKSKGLEFPIVIVPDMAQKPHGGRADDVLVHRELGMAAKVTGPDGKSEPSGMGRAIAARIRAEEEAEHARLLYVVLTRARDYLALCGSTRPVSGTWFDTLDAEFGVLACADGGHLKGPGWSARVWHAPDIFTASPLPTPESALPPLDELRLRAAPLAQAPTDRRTVSISAILDYMANGFDEDEERTGEEDAPRMSGGSTYAMARGSLVHRLFECWDFARDTLPPLETLVAEAGLGLSLRARLTADLSAIAERFRNSALWPRLAAVADSIQREAPFLLNAGDALISGTIDALLPDGTIVDYKTGKFREEGHERYEWQLLLYAAAVRQLKVCTPTAGILYYVDEDRCHEVALTPEHIDQALRHAREIITALRRS